MIVYFETNFLLELAYRQERCDSCQRMLDLAKHRTITLALPAVSAAEARATLKRRETERHELHSTLMTHIREISRSAPVRNPNLMAQSKDLVSSLIAGAQESREELEKTINTLVAVAVVIPLTSEVVMIGGHLELTYSLSPPDALVLASIRTHAEKVSGPKCFVSQDSKGFANPEVRGELAAVDCKVIANFDDALAHVTNALPPSE